MVMKGLKEKVDKRSEIIGEREKGEGRWEQGTQEVTCYQRRTKEIT